MTPIIIGAGKTTEEKLTFLEKLMGIKKPQEESKTATVVGLLGNKVISFARPLRPAGEPICNFCGKPKSKVPVLIQENPNSPGICILRCITLLAEEGIIVVQKEKT